MTVAGDTPDFLDAPSAGGFIMSGFAALSLTPFASSPGLTLYCGSTPSLLLAIDNILTTSVEWQLRFFADPGATNQVGATSLANLTQNLPRFMTFPIQAPYVQFWGNDLGGGAGTHLDYNFSGLFSDNPSPADVMGAQTLLTMQAVNVPASGTVTQSPTVHIPGTAKVFGTRGQTTTYRVEEWNGTAWSIFYQANQAANVDLADEVVIPVNDWRVQVIDNAAAAAGVYVNVMAGW